jgi:hypothetical protein
VHRAEVLPKEYVPVRGESRDLSEVLLLLGS